MWPSKILQPVYWRAGVVTEVPVTTVTLDTGVYTLTGQQVGIPSTAGQLVVRYSLNTSPLMWVNLPAPRFGSDYKKIRETNIENETYGGVVWVHRLSTRREWRLNFRVTEPDLSIFEILHAGVQGRLDPFYFQFAGDVLYCRKESGFAPRMLEVPIQPPMYDYELILTEEIAPISISS